MENTLDEFKNCTFPQNSRGKVSSDEEPKKCPKCEGSMWISWLDENGCEVAKRCECFEPTMARRRIAASGISGPFRVKGFKNFDTRDNPQLEKASTTCTDYCLNYQDIKNTRHNSILLLGQVGCGKTHLALASANALLDYQKIRVVYMPYREMVTRLKQNITDEDSYTRAIDTFKKAPMLVIDDLLKGKTTDSDINILFEIVNYRYVCGLPVIVTSEKTTSELLDFDSAIGSRLIEMAEGRIIELKGNELNYRLKGMQNDKIRGN